MVLSGYASQASSSPGARVLLSYAHIATGLLFALLFLSHLAATFQRRRPASRRATGTRPDAA
jgi:hypothetical protein